MSKLLYQDFVKTLSEAVEAKLTSIKAQYNFDLGDEFELALCEVLASILPDQYGIVRGHVVSRNGETAGDDIIITARNRFPTINARTRGDFSRKELVPVEAVYAYIEAKHTLHIQGDGGQSMKTAVAQVAAVKALVATREQVSNNQLGKYLKLHGDAVAFTSPEGFPAFQNPCFGMVVSRYVQATSKEARLTDAEVVRDEILKLGRLGEPNTAAPDSLVLGSDVVLIPVIGNTYHSPFVIPDKSHLQVQPVPGLAFGLGIASLLFALDWIELGVMPWMQIIGEPLVKKSP